MEPRQRSRGKKTKTRVYMTKNEQSMKWKRDHPEQVREHSRKYYLKNKDKILERGKEWHLANRERIIERKRERYYKIRETELMNVHLQFMQCA